MFLSIMGMYEYDPSIFDGLDIPTYTDPDEVTHIIDKNTVINNIVLQCAELELIYPTIDTMKLAIGVWSAANQESWKKLITSQFIEYNPIWNVDANISETQSRDISRTGSGSNNRTLNLSDKRSVKGFNADTWAEAEKNDHTGTDNTALTSTDAVDEDVTRTERRSGNIGVTATQDLIKKEREIAEFNIIDHITESFKKRFCLMVY